MTATKWTTCLLAGGILALGALSSLPAHAQTTLYNVFVQPIQVCASDGTSGAPLGAKAGDDYFQQEVSKIFAQASINVIFDPLHTYDNSLFTTTIDDSNQANSFSHLVYDSGHGQNADPTVLDLFFVSNLQSTSPGNLAGLGSVGANGVVINGDLVCNQYNPPYGRIDTVAHELGHNFGLGHTTFGAGGADNLMTAGSNRSVPSTLADINPDGLGLDKLTAAQVAEMQSVGLANGFLKPAGLASAAPEPSQWASLGFVVFSISGLIISRKRKSASQTSS